MTEKRKLAVCLCLMAFSLAFLSISCARPPDRITSATEDADPSRANIALAPAEPPESLTGLNARGNPKALDEGVFNRAMLALESGDIHSGQSVERFLEIATPWLSTQTGEFTTFDLAPVPNFTGVTVIAHNGVLVRAVEWGCTLQRVLFDVMSEAEQAEYNLAESAP